MKTAFIALFTAAGAHGALLVGVTGTNNLVTFDSDAPGTYVSNTQIINTQNGQFITNIAYDGDTGIHYGLDTSANFYRISLDGTATLVASSLALSSFDAGFGYDPLTGKLVFASSAISTFETDGSMLATSSIAFGAGDMNAGTAPDLFGFAVDPFNFETYVLDANLGVLGRIFDPSFSEIFTVGSIGFPVSAVGDLAFDGNGNLFAALSDDGFTTSLFSINTATGQASALGSFADGGVVTLAIPEPSVSFLALLALGSAAGIRRRII